MTRQELAPIATATVTERTSEAPQLRPVRASRELWGYREILANLVRKELKVKYTASFLGAVWSMLNPIVFLGGVLVRRARARQPRARLPGVPAVGSARVEPVLGVAGQRARAR